jgi:hypothetical protein
MVKGEPLAPPAGRADDFVWPRREAGHEQAKGETPVASVSPGGTVTAPGTPTPPKPVKKLRPAQSQPGTPVQAGTPAPRGFFGFGGPPQQPAPPPRAPGPAVPRPPANVGQSASVPGFFTRQ